MLRAVPSTGEKYQLYKVGNTHVNTSPANGCVFSVTTDKLPNEEQRVRGKWKFGAPLLKATFTTILHMRNAVCTCTRHYGSFCTDT
jgi:hypothetical protein